MATDVATTKAGTHPLDNAAWYSLTGPHARLAQGTDKALRYPADISPIVAVPAIQDAEVWSALRALIGPGESVALAVQVDRSPPGWEIVGQGAGVQLVAADALLSRPDPEVLTLTAEDADEMLALVASTEPGPFRPRTYEMGTYLGIRRGGSLVAMAGERLHPPGWTEISAVCTEPDHRGQGLASKLVRAVAHNIRQRGEKPFLHAAKTNVSAIRLYESLGFVFRREVIFTMLRTPAELGSEK